MTTLIPANDPGFVAKFDQFQHSVFRLETLQSYGNSKDDDGFAAFLAGDPPPANRFVDQWRDMIRRNAAAGRTQQRVHVVTEPLTDYMRFELTGYADSVAAGEDIRIVPIADGEPWPEQLPPLGTDYWLFDAHELYVQHYDDNGWWLGTEPVHDPAAIVDACRWRDAALHLGVPWSSYVRDHPQLTMHLASA